MSQNANVVIEFNTKKIVNSILKKRLNELILFVERTNPKRDFLRFNPQAPDLAFGENCQLFIAIPKEDVVCSKESYPD